MPTVFTRFVMGNVISISLIMVVRGARKRLRMVSLYLDNMAQKQSWPAQAWLLPNSLGTSAKVSHPQSQDRSFERTYEAECLHYKSTCDGI